MKRTEFARFWNRAKNKHECKTPEKPQNDVVYCIYHDKDLDGIMSAAIVCNEYENVRLIPYDYGYKVRPLSVEKNSLVFMVDCCMSDQMMQILSDRCDLRLIDHHPRAIESEVCKKLKGSRSYGTAACILTWEYFHPYKMIPEGIKLLGYYDVWDTSNKTIWEDRVIPFQYGMRQFVGNPKDKVFKQAIESKKEIINQIIAEGNAIVRYEKRQANLAMHKFSYTKSLLVNNKHYNVLVINRQLVGTDFFESKLDKNKHDFCLAYQECNGSYTYSLRGWKGGVEVNRIAKFFSPRGGGHKYAAGFTLNRNILTK